MTDAVSPLSVPDVKPMRGASTRSLSAGLTAAASGWIVPALILALWQAGSQPRLCVGNLAAVAARRCSPRPGG